MLSHDPWPQSHDRVRTVAHLFDLGIGSMEFGVAGWRRTALSLSPPQIPCCPRHRLVQRSALDSKSSCPTDDAPSTLSKDVSQDGCLCSCHLARSLASDAAPKDTANTGVHPSTTTTRLLPAQHPGKSPTVPPLYKVAQLARGTGPNHQDLGTLPGEGHQDG